MRQVSWYFKQMLPLQYRSRYSEDDNECIAIWRMWFGRVFWHRVFAFPSSGFITREFAKAMTRIKKLQGAILAIERAPLTEMNSDLRTAIGDAVKVVWEGAKCLKEANT